MRTKKKVSGESYREAARLYEAYKLFPESLISEIARALDEAFKQGTKYREPHRSPKSTPRIKKCTRCRKWKEGDDFSLTSGHGKQFRRSWCKRCMSKYYSSYSRIKRNRAKMDQSNGNLD